jgi:hypothetical protein
MLLKDIQENFPFVSVVSYGDAEYTGIIINQDAQVTSMYMFDRLRTVEDKRKFIELGEIWWMESNRLIPISIFLRKEMEYFRYSIQTMNSKDVHVKLGPAVNLNNLSIKRIKRKSVQLVRKTK